MAKFALELSHWGGWELERDFSSVQRAKNYADERFSQNEWRVLNRETGDIAYHYDPMQTLEQEASAELQRFETTNMWRTIYAEQSLQNTIRERQRTQMTEVAARQRRRQRWERTITIQPRRAVGFTFTFDDADSIFDEELSNKVNWLKEGF